MEVVRARYKYKSERSRRFLKRMLFAVMALLIFGGTGGYAALALSKPVGALTAESRSFEVTAPATFDITWPRTGQAAVGSLEDGLLAVTPNEQQKPIASITKLITALAVVEKLPLAIGEDGAEFVIGQADIASYRSYVAKSGSVMPVNLGQTISEYNALVGMLLPSGNNIADSLAVWTFGSMEAYLQYANTMLDRQGMTNTEVADASGFSPGSKSTPSDLIKLGQKVLQHPVLAEIIAKKSAVVPGSGELRNTNALLSDPAAIGIKTGNTDEAGNCLLYAYRLGSSEEQVFIGVVLDQPTYSGMFGIARALKESAVVNYKAIELVPAGTVVGNYKTAWGAESQAVTAEPVKIYGWAGRTYDVQVSLEEVSVPSSANQVVGTLWVSGYSASSDIISQTSLSAPDAWWRLTNYW